MWDEAGESLCSRLVFSGTRGYCCFQRTEKLRVIQVRGQACQCAFFRVVVPDSGCDSHCARKLGGIQERGEFPQFQFAADVILAGFRGIQQALRDAVPCRVFQLAGQCHKFDLDFSVPLRIDGTGRVQCSENGTSAGRLLQVLSQAGERQSSSCFIANDGGCVESTVELAGEQIWGQVAQSPPTGVLVANGNCRIQCAVEGTHSFGSF